MSDPIDMLSTEELTELVELRKQMETIQARYNELVGKLRGTGTTMPAPDPVVPAAVPSEPARAQTYPAGSALAQAAERTQPSQPQSQVPEPVPASSVDDSAEVESVAEDIVEDASA